MTGMNAVLQNILSRCYRYFPKNTLAPFVEVGRISASTKPPMTSAAAMMLSVATSEAS